MKDFASGLKNNLKIQNYSNVLISSSNNIDQIILPRSKISHYLQISHNDNGHSGVDRISHLLSHFDWPGKFFELVPNLFIAERLIYAKNRNSVKKFKSWFKTI